MACSITYNNREFTESEFRDYVESNPAEFGEYFLSLVDSNPNHLGSDPVFYDTAEARRVLKNKMVDSLGDFESDIPAASQRERLNRIGANNVLSEGLEPNMLIAWKKTGNLYVLGSTDNAGDKLRGEALLSYYEDGLNPDDFFLYNLDPVEIVGNQVMLKNIDEESPLFGISESNFFGQFSIVGEFNKKPEKDQTVLDSSIGYQFKAADAILNNLDKIKRWEAQVQNPPVLWEKIQKDLGVSKAQIDLIKAQEGKDVEEKLTNFLANYSYTVEVEPSMENAKYSKGYFVQQSPFGWWSIYDGEGVTYKEGFKTEQEANDYAENVNKGVKVPSNHYATMTVPGGTNYTESEIRTPDITPSIRGHAEFATGQGIGWFRSDEKVSDKDKIEQDKISNKFSDTPGEEYPLVTHRGEGSKTRRILEVQSDLFQKYRKLHGTDERYESLASKPLEGTLGEMTDQEGSAFLSLLEKDANWVTFFIKSIIQDSAKRGYEKVFFPAGQTAAKVEGHQTQEDFIAQKKKELAKIEEESTPEGLEKLYKGVYNDIKKNIELFKLQEKDHLVQMKLDINDLKDDYISKHNYDSDYDYIRVRPNFWNRRFDKKSKETLTGDNYDGWVIDEYDNNSQAKPRKVTKISKAEAEKLLRDNLKDKAEEAAIMAREAEDTLETHLLNREDWIKNKKEASERYEKAIREQLKAGEEGRLKLSAISDFYEHNIQNILKKKGYNPTSITDEYGNKWFEVKLDEEDKGEIVLDSSITAPNGEPSKLYGSILYATKDEARAMEIYNKTKTKEFKDWFGKSKVLDENGEPLVVYHGTDTAFDRFDKELRGKTTGKSTTGEFDSENAFFFTDNHNVAFHYSILGRQEEILHIIYKLGKIARPLFQSKEETMKHYQELRAENPKFAAYVDDLKSKGLDNKAIMEELKKLHQRYEDIRDLARGGAIANSRRYYNDVERIANELKRDKELIRSGTFRSYSDFGKEYSFGTSTGYDSVSISSDGQIHYGLKDIKPELKKITGKNIKNLTSQEFDDLVEAFYETVKYGRKKEAEDTKKGGFTPKIRAVFLKIEDPIEKDFKGEPFVMQMDGRGAVLEASKMTIQAAKEGKDGVIFRNIADPELSSNYGVFESNQIKSIFNKGTFNSDTEVIYDSSISDLEAGLKEAATDKAKFDTQLERLLAESGKINKIIGQVHEDFVRKGLRDALRKVRDDKKELSNFMGLLLEARETLKFYAEDLKKIKNLDTDDAIAQLSRASSVADAFSDLVNFLKKDFQFVDSTNEFKKLVDSLALHYDQIQTIKESTSEDLMIDFMSKELEGDAKISYDKLKAQQENLETQLARARANGSSAKYIKGLEDKISKVKLDIVKLVPNADNLRDIAKGLREDVNWFSGNFRSALAMGDPILSGYSRRLKRGFNQVRAALQPIRNQAQQEVADYMRATGHNPRQSMAKVYEGLYQVNKYDSYDDEGKLKSEEAQALLGPIEQKFYNEDAKYRNDIKQARAAGDPEKLAKAQLDYNKWLNEYTERRYDAQWYDRFNLLTTQAYEARERILREINNKLQGPNRDSLTDADYERIADLKHDLKALGSIYTREGVLKTGEPLAIAESIRAFNKETSRMATWTVTDENRRWFKIINDKKKDQVEKGILTPEQYKAWWAANTHRVIHPDFYKERQIIIDKIQAVMSKLPEQTFKGDIKTLWERILGVSRPYRDEDNIMVGSDLSAQEASLTRSDEIAIEELKAKLIRFSGLTIGEEQELKGLWGSLDTLTPAEINRFMDLRDYSDEYKDEMERYISKQELNSLFMAFAELAAISKFEPTSYYETTYRSKLREFQATIDPNNLLQTEELDNRFQEEDQWFKDNHIKKIKKLYDDGRTWFEEVNEPLYIWKDIIPTDEKWIEEEAPGFAFKTRQVKPEFINQKYEDLNYQYFRATEQKDFRLIPKRIVDGKLSPYMSEDYERLNRSDSPTDRAKAKMLTFLTDTHLIGQQKLPRYKRLDYALPGVQKTEYDRALENGVKGVKEGIKDAFRVTQEDKDLTLGDISQRDLSIIPVKFSTKVKPENQDLDLAGTILKHRAGIEEYSYLEGELPYAELIQSTLKNAPKDISQSMVDRTLKMLGMDKFIRGTKDSQRLKTFDSFMRTMFYGETEVSPFNSDTWNKRIKSAMGLATLQVMTFNFPAHITNILSGEIQNVIESAAGRYMTFKDYLRAKSIYTSNIPNFWNDYTKEGNKTFWSAFAEKLDVPQGEFIDNMGKNTRFSRLRDAKNTVMLIKQGGEHEIQVSTLIAMTLNKKVKLNGNPVSLDKAMELKDGQIRIKDAVTTMQGEPFTESDLNAFQDQVHTIVRALNGAYSKIDKTVAEKSFLGKLAFFMRKYFLPMAYRRFEDFKYDYEERDFKEGYYRTLWRILGDVWKFNTDLYKNWDTYKNTFTDLEKRNLRRLAAEVAIIGLLATTILMVGGYDDDRELEGRWFYTMTLYELMKMKSEAETLIPLPTLGFDELSSLFSSPFVPATTAKTLNRTGKDFLYWAFGSEDARFKRDYGIWDEGDLRLKADALKLIGVPVNMLTPENLVKNFELRNR